jgi:O-antigen/teichoic acid export membrane protein
MKRLNHKEYFNTDQLGSNLKNRALRGAGATMFSNVAMFGIQMIGTVVLARLLRPDDFGLVAMVAAFSLLFQNVGLRGLTEATIQSEVIDHKKISKLFWIHVGLSLLLTLCFIALTPVMIWLYKDPRLELITIVIAMSFVFTALSTQHLALLVRNMQFYRITGIEIMATIVTQVVAITMAIQGYEYWALVGRRIAPMVATAVGAWILCRWIPGLPAQATGVGSMLKFGMNTYGNFATNYLSRNLDKVLIGWRYGAESLGHYERAYYLFVMPVTQLSHPLTNVAVATLSRLRNDPEKYQRYYLKAVSMLALIGMPLSAILTLTGKDILLLLLGPQWDKAGELFTVFGPGIGITLIYGTHGWLHLSLGKADRWFRWGMVELIACAVCFVIGLPFGAIGVVVAYTASFYLLVGPGLWYAGKPAGITFFSVFSQTWKYFLSALAAGILTWFALYRVYATADAFTGLNVFLRISVSATLCTLLYVALGIVFFGNWEWIVEFISFLRGMVSNIRPRGAEF